MLYPICCARSSPLYAAVGPQPVIIAAPETPAPAIITHVAMLFMAVFMAWDSFF
jgi:hypothetical protein